jgi:Domain of unknown function (DUF3786)
MGCAKPTPFHWEDLRNRPREAVLAHEGVKALENGDGYELTFLDSVYRMDVKRETIRELSPRPDRGLSEQFQILLVRYLIRDHGGPVTGTDITEKDLTGGVTFFQGPHTLHVEPIVKCFGTNPEGFKELGHKLGAVPVENGDAGMKFFPFPAIPVTYVLWAEDSEFPASMTVLFDKSIERWFSLDEVFMLVYTLTDRIVEDCLP